MIPAIRRAAPADAGAIRALVQRAYERMTENLALYARLGYEETEHSSGDGFARVYFHKRVVDERPG